MNAKILSAALGLVTLLFVGFVWWVYVAAGGKMHWAIPVACTVAPLVLVLVLWLVQRAAARKAAANLEEALREDGAKQQRQGGQSSAEVVRLRSEFDRAVAALRSSKLGSRDGNAGDALYRLPWYTIIGPPASGKTTVLRNSGLKFPYLPGTGDRLKGVGGTRNCDWWLTNHAILLDTAGRWTLEDDDRDEWLAFLDLLKRHRGKRPLNGVIAAVSVAGDEATSIGSLPLSEVRTLATKMRERLDEITGQLGLAMPVYLMFTKCDLIPGFVETFGTLSSEERRQVWGFTTPLLSGAGDPGSHLGTEFDALLDSLERHAVARLSQEVEQVVIPQIYDFPAQLGALREKLVTFADAFFEDSAFGETPFMRGVYFTSGTQEGAPSDMLLRDVADRLNVRPQPSEPRGEKKSYFLYDMLMNVVFEDRGIATASQHELLRQRRRRRVVSSSLFAFAAVAAGLPTLSCRHNLDSIARTREIVTASLQTGPVPPGVDTPQQLPELTALRDETERYSGGLPAKIASFGLSPGEDIRGPLVRYYGLSLKERVVRPLLNRSNERLITMTRQYEALRKQGHATIALNEQASATLRSALKLHLLLATPRDACTPPLAKRADWVGARLKSLWTQASPGAPPAELTEHDALVSQYLDLNSTFPDLNLGRDERSVQLARAALSNDDKASRLLEAALEKFGEGPRDLQQIAGATVWIHDDVTIPDAFTRDAWTRIAEEINSSQNWSFGDEDWVLGCNHVAPEQLSEKQSQSFEREYLKRYTTHWQSFVQGLSTRQPANLEDAANVLVEYVSRPGVLGRLFQVVKDNTDLPPAPAGTQDVLLGALTDNAKSVVNAKGKAIADKVGAAVPRERKSPERERVSKTFAEFANFGVPVREGVETPLEQYRRQLEPVLAALRGYKADPNRLEALSTATRTALDNVDLLLASHAGAWNDKLRELLLPPLTGIAAIVFNDRGTQVERKWCELVYRPFQQELAGRFPFEPNATEAVSLQTFNRFFQPGTGILWNFLSTQLAGYVSQEGGRYRFGIADGADARALFRDDLLQFLTRANRVRDAFFPYGATTPRVPFRIRVRGAPGFSMTSFKLGANTVRYDSGEERWVSVEWPGDQPGLGASLAVTPYQGQGPRPLTLDGEWGLFMILDERFGASVLDRSGRQMTVGWKPKGGTHWIKVDFASDDPHSPILAAPFGDSSTSLLPISIPARIAQHGAGC